MAAYGASDLSNRETGDITDEYNDQSGDIEYNRGVTTRKYDDEYKKSRVGRQNALANVHQEFDDAENSLRQKIATSSPDAGTAQAQVDAIQSKWGNWNAPSVDLAAQLPEYDGKGVGAKDLAGAVQGPTLTPSQAAQFFSVNRKKDDSETAY
jgi:hypothetical protein